MIAIVREGDEKTMLADRVVTHDDGTQSIVLADGQVNSREAGGWGTRPTGVYGPWEKAKPNGAFLLYRNEGRVAWVRVFEQVP